MTDPSDYQARPAFLLSKYPVFWPATSALTASKDDFDKFVKSSLAPRFTKSAHKSEPENDKTTSAANDSTTTAQVTQDMADVHIEQESISADIVDDDNKMLTANGDITNISSENALVDLFAEMEDAIEGPRLNELLSVAWSEDSLATLKLIFNTRSIHLGKSTKKTFYRACGWLASEHPLTLLTNLEWLSRPVIEKKVAKESGNDDVVLVEHEKSEADPSRFDVKNGVAHGYWKDLLNILALSVNDKLDVLSNPGNVLNVHIVESYSTRNWDPVVAKEKRNDLKDTRHANAVRCYNEVPFYQALSMTVARLFAEQLETDLKLLRSTDFMTRRKVSLCAKWAPSQKGFHDKHTFVVSSIAEIMYPESKSSTVGREVYLRYARELYRKDVAALRKFLEVVERDISSGQLNNIRYDHVPSLAMSNYASLFIQKDGERFEQYIDQVIDGKKQISGATLLPSTLVQAARNSRSTTPAKKATKKLETGAVYNKVKEKVGNEQWKTLVQRIRDSGNLQDCIAVCDVSGSMLGPDFSDGSTPLDSAIGLSLLIAELTKAPFGGKFLTFAAVPKLVQVDLNGTLAEKVAEMMSSEWGTSTDFVSVFELILNLAESHEIAPENMVKRIFVFSDMHFNRAEDSNPLANTITYDRAPRPRRAMLTNSYQEIKRRFEQSKYEIPELVFWNLNGGRHGVAPKPVTQEDTGTVLVSGYSQGMLKVFLNNGTFEADEEDVVTKDVKDEDGDEITLVERKKRKLDPLALVKKAIGHRAYEMLKVVD